MAKNVFISSSLSPSWRLCQIWRNSLKAFLRYRVHENGTDRHPKNTMKDYCTTKPLACVKSWDLHKKLIFSPTILSPTLDMNNSSSLMASLLTLFLTSSQPTHSYPAGRAASHRWRRNAETSCSSWGPRAAHRVILKAASLRSVTHRLADTPRVSCTCWWTKLWGWITAATEPGGVRFHHRCSGGRAQEFVGNVKDTKLKGNSSTVQGVPVDVLQLGQVISCNSLQAIHAFLVLCLVPSQYS